MEALRRVDGVLTQHRVDDEERLGGGEELVEVGDLRHHRFVDREAAGRVDDEDVEEVAAGVVDGARGDVKRLLTRMARVPLRPGLRRDGLQLLNGRGAVDVAGNREDLLLLGFNEVLRELPGGGGLTRTLETRQKDHGRRLHAQVDLALVAGEVPAHDGGELALHDPDQGLARVEVPDHLLAHRLLFDAGEHFAHDRERHVRFKKREADFAEHVAGVLFGEARLTAHDLDDFGEALAE